jgi:hypothetical protein
MADGKPQPYGIHYEMRIRVHMLKSFIFEWILHSQFESACRKSRDVNFKPYFEKTLMDSYKESCENNMYEKYL